MVEDTRKDDKEVEDDGKGKFFMKEKSSFNNTSPPLN
jgi:hypothetical protein